MGKSCHAFLGEYRDLGRVELVKRLHLVPHHVKHISLTNTKFRVVFDASAKDSCGTSLKDTLLTGPKLQGDISDIFCVFRIYKFAVSADVLLQNLDFNIYCSDFLQWCLSNNINLTL